MTHQQILSFTVIALMMGAFIWGKFRYDVVALCALLLAIAVGVVPFDRAFSGFSDDIVIIVGSASSSAQAWRVPGSCRSRFNVSCRK